MNAIRLLRPQQWLKNLFLFAPLIFSKHLFESRYFLTELTAFLAFCFVSSAVYIINDIADREADLLHPTKRSRPIAAGTISIGNALFLGVVLLLAASALLSRLSISVSIVIAMYLTLNVLYSLWFKRVILIDVFIVSAGFMLRVLAGVFAIRVEISPWLVLCTLFISVFLAVSKRRAELMLTSAMESFTTRPVLREYDVAFVDQLMTIAAAGVAISYALYTVAERTVMIFQTENLIFTTVFVLFGIFRYLFLIRRDRTEDNPAHVLLSDLSMMVNIAAWFVACVLIIYSTELRTWLRLQ
jgi:4-hydroxybenzoate polyprenyltransferase